jgi:magnesium-transporting ATPase (P-type)
MKNILKPIFEMVTGELMFSDDIICNYIVMGIIGLIAFGLSWRFVGWLKDKDIIRGGRISSAIHWIVRFICVVVLFVVFSWVVVIVRFIINIPFYVWIIILGAIVLVILIMAIAKIRKKKNKRKKSESDST